jgi:hypothetical protein
MDLSPLVELRSWLHTTPWLWDGLIFIGEHARQIMAAGVCWIMALTIIRVRHSGGPTAPPASEPAPVQADIASDVAAATPSNR